MDKKKLIGLAVVLVVALASVLLGVDVKGLVCDPAAPVAAVVSQ